MEILLIQKIILKEVSNKIFLEKGGRKVKNKKTLKKVLTVVMILLVFLMIMLLLLWYQKIKDINDIYDDYSENTVQNRLLEDVEIEKDKNTEHNSLMEMKNGEDVLGIIKIDKIGYEGLVYEGTELDTLSKGVGHFKSSPYFEGNVCLAAHNTIQHWAKLNTVEIGDEITYTSFLGTKKYKISNVTEIEETDWSMLEETSDNRITLITCVRGKPSQRLCVQGLEIK